MSTQERRRSRRKGASKPAAPVVEMSRADATPVARAGRWLLGAGVALGVFGVPSVYWLGLRNPFGPPKALALACATALVLAGLVLAPDALESAARAIIRRSRIAWALAALCALAALSTMTAIDARQALLGGYPDYRGLASVFAYAVIGVGALAAWQLKDGAVWLGRGATACLLWVGAIGALQRVGHFPVGVRGDFGTAWRVSSTPGNSSNLGVFLAVLLPIVIWVALRDPRREWRLAAWVAVGFGALSLVWTLSRGAWLAAIAQGVVTGAVLAWRYRGAWRGAVRGRVAWIAGAAVVVLVVGVALTPTFASRASRLFDSGSATGAWRLSTWRSAAAMTLARPFLGFGPNQFRYAYPRFQEPGQIDGRTGYPIVESAHNLEADTGTSFGLLGLVALLAVGALSASVAVRGSRADAASRSGAERTGGRGLESAPAAALGLGLLGGVVSLQFHYVTMDTGPVLALVLAGLVGIDARLASTEEAQGEVAPSRPHPALAGSLGLLGVLYVGAAVAAGGLIGADRADAKAESMLRAGAPWAAVSTQLARAEALAPWEAQVVRERGTLATAAVGRRFDSTAALQGIRALDAASAMTPADAVLAAERGNLLLAAGVAAKDRSLLERAASTFADAETMDPRTGISAAGRASALLALGRTEEAIALFERALALSPRYAQGWRNLALAYRSTGRELEAKRAEYRAKKWAD